LIEEGPEMEMTVSQYDTSMLMQEVKQFVMQTLVVGFMHYKWKFLVPLLVTVIMSLNNKRDSMLVRIYVHGETGIATKRPFKRKTSGWAKAFDNPNGTKPKRELSAKAKRKKNKRDRAKNKANKGD
jgi:hypothetical protein